ncbi:hypothetical protein AVEN_71460-1 [Araneus ventricosus]|uniref:Uncharacterized protein n=1 Tax=Araneus ventricosus TaxID=182803 RepID=A0A4Y2CU63_ARAVE|nr:hypothetical protein AVEN_71460-1 [Araneus ventricosus]
MLVQKETYKVKEQRLNNKDRKPPHVPVPEAITATEPVEWTWDNNKDKRLGVQKMSCYRETEFYFCIKTKKPKILTLMTSSQTSQENTMHCPARDEIYVDPPSED